MTRIASIPSAMLIRELRRRVAMGERMPLKRAVPAGDEIVQCVFRLPRTKREGLNVYAALHDVTVETLMRRHTDELLGYDETAAGVSREERAESAVSAPLGRRAGGQR